MTDRVPARLVARVCVVLPIIALAVGYAPQDQALVAALKLVSATLAVGAAPGIVAVLLLRPLSRPTMLEVVGLGITISLGLVQVFTVISLLCHVPAATVAVVLSVMTMVLALAAASSWTPTTATISLWRWEGILSVFLALLAVLLYLKGSPVFAGEDQTHASIVRRLAWLTRPSVENLYVVPGVVYVYPFPGVHYFMAAVSRLGGVDPLFVYEKLRFFWAMPAILCLYLAARLSYRSERVVACVMIVAGLFIMNGAFADVPGYYWGQLTPYSHNSDVAMNVLLPGLLVLSLYFLKARDRRGQIVFFAATIALAVTVIVVHIREIVQWFVYLCAYGLALLAGRQKRPSLRRIGFVVIPVTILTGSYVLLHQALVQHVAAKDSLVKTELLTLLRDRSLFQLISRPIGIVVGGFESMSYGWNGVLLLACPLLILLFWRHRIAWLAGSAVFVYLLIIRVPVLTIPYVLMTYSEILVTPVRNIVFFMYLLAGGLFYAIAVNLAKIHGRRARLVATICACGGLVMWFWFGELIAIRRRALLVATDILVISVLVGFGTIVTLVRRPTVRAWAVGAMPRRPPRGWTIAFAALVLPVAIFTALPRSSPFNVHSVNAPLAPFPGSAPVWLTPASVIEGVGCLDLPPGALRYRDGSAHVEEISLRLAACPPSPRLVEWAARALPQSAVLATNSFTVYPAPVFLPQQVVGWPVAYSGHLLDPRKLYPKYYEFTDRAMARYGTQSFFNSSESLEERREFARVLGVTHVLVDPMYYRVMTAALASWPLEFVPLFDDGHWAVYRVAHPG